MIFLKKTSKWFYFSMLIIIVITLILILLVHIFNVTPVNDEDNNYTCEMVK